MNNVLAGQAGLLLAALFVGAFRLLPSRPLIAGALFGLLTVKPQLGLVVPIVLVALGAWRAIGAAVATSILLALSSVALYGLEPWQAYLSVTRIHQWNFIVRMDGFYAFSMCSPYSGFRWLGMPASAALAAHAAVAVAVMATTVLAVRSSAAWSLKVAIVAIAAVSVTPYVLTYDLAIPMAALLWHLRERGAPLSRPQEWAFFVMWMSAFAATLYMQPLGVPIGSASVLVTYVAFVADAVAAPQTADDNPPPGEVPAIRTECWYRRLALAIVCVRRRPVPLATHGPRSAH